MDRDVDGDFGSRSSLPRQPRLTSVATSPDISVGRLQLGEGRGHQKAISNQIPWAEKPRRVQEHGLATGLRSGNSE
jgi:hypothetical protein